MFLNLKTIRTAREHVEEVYEPERFKAEGDDFAIAAPVALGFDIEKVKERYRLVGTVSTTLELLCGRCLELFARRVDAAFDLRYQPHTENTGEGELEIEEDDLSTAFYENDQIDLEQLVREQLLLSLPMKPLCREECKGLCPVCGTNLNRGTCACTRDWVDPRLAALKRAFRPEFLNRIDEIIVFHSLGRDQLKLIVEKMLRDLVDKVPADLKQQVETKVAALKTALQGKDAVVDVVFGFTLLTKA